MDINMAIRKQYDSIQQVHIKKSRLMLVYFTSQVKLGDVGTWGRT